MVANCNIRLIRSASLHVLEARLLQEIRKEKVRDAFQSVTVLSASNLLGRYLARQLVRNGQPHLATYFLTFADLAQALTRRHFLETQQTPLPLNGRTVLLWSLVHSLPSTSYFSSVREQPHFPSVLEATFADIEDSRIDFEKAVRQAPWESDASRQKVEELERLYRSYRQGIQQRFISEADLLLEAGKQAPQFLQVFGSKKLFVYGFYDLTGAQRAGLLALAQQLPLTVFLLSGDDGRYSFSSRLRDWLLHAGAQEENLAEEPTTSNLTVVRQQVFTSAKQPQSGDGTLQIISCPNEVVEAREIAREAIRLRREEGIAFHDMAVVMRDVENSIPVLVKTFDTVGLPYYLREGLPLARTAFGKSLLSLLRLANRGFRRFDVMEWLTQGAVDPRSLTQDRSAAPLSIWERISIEAGIVEGEQQWRDRLTGLLDGLSQQLAKAEARRRLFLEHQRECTQQMLDFLARLFSRLRELERETSWMRLSDKIIALLREFLFPAPQRDEVEDALDSLKLLDVLGEKADFREFTSMLETVLRNSSRTVGEFQRTGIHLLSITASRHARFRVVFVPGMIEAQFPLRGKQDPILLDAEREKLAGPDGTPALPLKRRRPQEERLLFLLALESATERLVLSFPRADVVAGAEHIPSYYVLRVLECLSGRPATYADLESRNATDPFLKFVSNARILTTAQNNCVDAREYDLSEVHRCLASDKPERARYLEGISTTFARTVEAHLALWDKKELTAFDGLLQSPGCFEGLASIFASDRVFSPTAFERYAACPYHFFLEHVLYLEPLEEPETIEQIDPMAKGALIHDILLGFYERMKVEGLLPLNRPHIPQYIRALDEVCAQQFALTETRRITGYALAWDLVKKQLREDLERHLLAEIDRGQEWTPERFEHGFGYRENEPLRFTAGTHRILMRGKIDRIDLAQAGKLLRVLDYKTGKRRTNDEVGFDGGRMLQLPLYLWAATQLFPEANLEESVAEYCYVSRAGGWRPSVFTGQSYQEKAKMLRSILEAIMENCKQGIFPRNPENDSYPQCNMCPFKAIGDNRHDALWNRKKDDPRLTKYLRMRTLD
ncbi:MAG: exodeoxyribonuclease V subunit gamma [Acidobacteria bacterium]|nr:exodeoxyribonuclease V subunit gamma [Acidobacteriota bacterium]